MDTWQLILLIMLLTVIVSYVIVIVRDRIIVPMPFEFDTTEGFQEETLRTDELYDKFYASVYDKIFQHDKLVQAETVLILQEWTKDRKVKDMRILDVCCGTGVATCMFAKQGVEKAVGVDKSAAMLALRAFIFHRCNHVVVCRYILCPSSCSKQPRSAMSEHSLMKARPYFSLTPSVQAVGSLLSMVRLPSIITAHRGNRYGSPMRL